MGKAPPDWAVGPWHADIEPGVEVRPADDGTIDEIVVELPGGALFHLEQLDDGQYWISLSWKDGEESRDQHVVLTRHGKHIYPTLNR